jgi:NADH-quinone oxidoreductase subunit H
MTLLALPFTEHWGVRNLQLGLFYIFAISGVSVIGYIAAGWASDNKYALLGAVRSAAQLISYEIPLLLALLSVSIVAGSLNLNDIALGQSRVPNLILQPLPFVILITAILAELSRRPFDIPIGESELVGGPWVEFSGIRWSMLFALTEYASLWGLSILGSLLFLGGWEWPFGHWLGDGWNWAWQLLLTAVKSFFLILVVMWIGASFPRLRIDQLMNFCWKILLPFGFLQVLVNGIVRVYVDDNTVRGVIFGVSSLALLVGMAMVIVRATKVPSRDERLRTIFMAPSPSRRAAGSTGSVAS